MLRKLTSFLTSLGVSAVFDTSASRDVALVEACHEFVRAFRSDEARRKRLVRHMALAGGGNRKGAVKGIQVANLDCHSCSKQQRFPLGFFFTADVNACFLVPVRLEKGASRSKAPPPPNYIARSCILLILGWAVPACLHARP